MSGVITIDSSILTGAIMADLVRKDRVLVLEGETNYCYAPEWWSHKTFWLKFHPKTKELIVHNGVCAKVYADGELIYAYQLFDRFKPGGKRFGGDTWGAIASTEDSVFFGGFAYADTSLSDSNLTFVNKYSHIHRIGSDGRTISLVWYDGPGTTTSWVGEVTDMLYSPKDYAIYFLRGDGGTDIWKLDLSSMQVSRATNTGLSLFKMELLYDTIYAIGNDPSSGNGVIVKYSLQDYTTTIINSVTGVHMSNTPVRLYGQIVQYLNRLWAFGIGGVVSIEPKWNEYRQMPFFNLSYAPRIVGLRSQKAYVMGLPFIPVNPIEMDDEPACNTGFLLRFDPLNPMLVMPTGYVSGMETDGRSLYIGTSPQNHNYTVTPVNYEPGVGGVFEIPVATLLGKPFSPIHIHDRIWNWTSDTYHLGIPTTGYSKKILRINAPSSFTLNIVFYSLTYNGIKIFPENTTVNLNAGWNKIDLSSYEGVVAMAPTSDVGGYTWMDFILIP